jgi:manganese/iron transport system substrate-binding protein
MKINRIKSVFVLLLMAHLTFELSIANVHTKKIKVVTTFTILDDMVKQVAGDQAEVVCLIKYGAEIHSYEPTPQDLVKIQNADLIIWNGLKLEQWFEKFFANQKHIPSMIATEGIKTFPIISGDYANLPNPHAWMTPLNGKIYVSNIKNALIKVDPKNANAYEQNAAAYAKKLDEIHQYIKQEFNKIPPANRWIASSEGAFSYLANAYEFHEAFLWPINADQQGTPKQIKNMIETIRKNNIVAMFSESTVSDRPAIQVARETKIHYGGKLYVDSLSGPAGPVPTYLTLLKLNADTIAQEILKGLNKKR